MVCFVILEKVDEHAKFIFQCPWEKVTHKIRVECVTVPTCVTRVRGLVLAFDFLGALLFSSDPLCNFQQTCL